MAKEFLVSYGARLSNAWPTGQSVAHHAVWSGPPCCLMWPAMLSGVAHHAVWCGPPCCLVWPAMLSGVARHAVWCGPPCCLVWPAMLSGVARPEVKVRELNYIYLGCNGEMEGIEIVSTFHYLAFIYTYIHGPRIHWASRRFSPPTFSYIVIEHITLLLTNIFISSFYITLRFWYVPV